MADMDKRFFSASDGKKTEDPKVLDSQAINSAVRSLAIVIDSILPDDRSEQNRQKAIALSHLEDVQMHANRGIFTPKSF